jgi:hypothetical protein
MTLNDFLLTVRALFETEAMALQDLSTAFDLAVESIGAENVARSLSQMPKQAA